MPRPMGVRFKKGPNRDGFEKVALRILSRMGVRGDWALGVPNELKILNSRRNCLSAIQFVQV